MKNLKEFKELIERYESITIEEIEETGKFVSDYPFVKHQSTINKLTGFGKSTTCVLCNAIIHNHCDGCVYLNGSNINFMLKCTQFQFKKSFDNIRNASNAEELLSAIKERAIVMREHLKTIEQ